METLLFLTISPFLLANWYPTVNGQRQTLPYIEAQYPYTLGISMPPSDLTFITVTHNDLPYFAGYCQGTTVLGEIDSGIIEMRGGGQEYRIVPEPATILLTLSGIFALRRNHVKNRHTHG